MQGEFEMSMMGELKYFLGFQIQQGNEGTFINQSKYTKDLLKRFGMEHSKPCKTPMSITTKLDKDENGKEVDQKLYRSMIGSLLYLIASRPDIMFSVCLCARYQSLLAFATPIICSPYVILMINKHRLLVCIII
ncbi:RVT_2 domain-containing protein [Cephalotus follicularis]|uniref:RVT_2 domain-containing protein n=1 Tax=Cephalotus follicularis TaxID=3775 RepID=A0A1Q3AQ68_CEPFO|nr:RVT_2 domain-containing protein [Cephalotus follicularis]